MLSQNPIELRDSESLRFPMSVACYYLKTVAFAEAQFSVGLSLECIQRHLQKDNNLFFCQNKPYDMIPDCI